VDEPRPGQEARPGETVPVRPALGASYRETLGPRVVPAYPAQADLHVHSRRSDGVMEPAALVEAAAAAGVRLLALADHDTLAGVRELRALDAASLPLELLPGVEINSVATGVDCLWEGELHILGLGLDPDDKAFEAALERQRRAREARTQLMLERLRKLGLPVDEDSPALQTAPGGSIGRPQVARSLVEAGHAASVDDAMKRLLARGRPAYVPRQGLGPVEAINAIRQAGGLAVLAHFPDAPQRRDLVEQLMAAGLGGLEVYYRKFDAGTVAAMAELAAELRLVPTGGSDYHGDGETYAEAHAGLFIPNQVGAGLLEALGRPQGTLEGGAGLRRGRAKL
jgi:predicted metal-dependent phosphoesterase TrpH